MTADPSVQTARSALIPYALAGLAIVVADQVTKWLVVARLGPDQTDHRREVLGRFFAIHYVENTGIAFGLLRGQAAVVNLLVVVAAVLVGALAVRSAGRSPLALLGVTFVLAGAAGNLIDRVRFGYVVDFISVAVWPTFNIADSAITVGALLLGWRFVVTDDARTVEDAPREWRSSRPAPANGPGER